MKKKNDVNSYERKANCMLTEAILGLKPLCSTDLNSYETAWDENKQEQLIEVLNQVMETLNEQEKQVIANRFGFVGEKKSCQEIGEEMGMSKEEVRDIEMIALRKLRHPKRSRRLRAIVENNE